jgi:hypothetical protein
LFAEHKDADVRGYAVWVPKFAGREWNVSRASTFISDPRVSHYWDGSGLLVHAYSSVLGIGRDAWDMFLVYGPQARWEGREPPRPDFWMHQLPGISIAPRLEGDALAREAIARIPARTPKEPDEIPRR